MTVPFDSQTYPPRSLDDYCSRHFRWRDLIECGETWHRLATGVSLCANLPLQEDTWKGIVQLATQILDPVVDQFGPVEITYGFASAALTRQIHGRIAPRLDQHSGSELRRNGELVCPRRGQAVDLRVPGVSSSVIAEYVARRLQFDRLYFYDDDRPFHVSVGPDTSGTIVRMDRTRNGGYIPRVVNVL